MCFSTTSSGNGREQSLFWTLQFGESAQERCRRLHRDEIWNRRSDLNLDPEEVVRTSRGQVSISRKKSLCRYPRQLGNVRRDEPVPSSTSPACLVLHMWNGSWLKYSMRFSITTTSPRRNYIRREEEVAFFVTCSQMYIEKTNRSGDYCAVAVTDVAKRNYPFPRYHGLFLNRAGQVCLFDYTSRDLNNQPTASSTNLQLSSSWTYFTTAATMVHF